jgi:hypothetical protein
MAQTPGPGNLKAVTPEPQKAGRSAKMNGHYTPIQMVSTRPAAKGQNEATRNRPRNFARLAVMPNIFNENVDRRLRHAHRDLP